MIASFALETFEVECFLLDPAALAGCSINTAGRTEAQIDERLREQARALLWWMACRKVIAGLREARQEAFPSHPKRGQVRSREQAERVLLGNEWVMLTVPGLPDKIRAGSIREALIGAHAHYAALLEEDCWTRDFSGKEILLELVSWIFTKDRPPGNAALHDIAKAVAREQLAAGRAPPELLELRKAMLERLPRPS